MLCIVRHGQTDWNVEGKIAGRTNISLNETGKIQANEVREKLTNIDFDYVFSSPLERALETAKIITSKEIIVDDRLIERCNGIFEGMYTKEIYAYGPIDENNPKDTGLEPLTEMQKRIESFFKDLKKDYSGKNILIVTHAGLIINIRCLLEGEPKDGDITPYRVKNCQVLTYDDWEDRL